MLMLKATHERAMANAEVSRVTWLNKYTKKCEEHTQLNDKLTEQFEFKEKKAVAALESRLEKEKLKFEGELQNKMSTFKETELAKMYDKLSGSLTKLHEEGNANSKFIQEMNLTMANALVPAMAANKQIESK